MKKLFVTMAMATLAVGAFAQGTITFQNTAGAGKEKFIYGVKASDPLAAAQGDAADYSGREKVGAGYAAELLLSTDGGATFSVINKTTFKTGATAGLLNGNSKLAVAGMIGGTKVSLAIRVWDSAAGGDDYSKIGDNISRGMSKWVNNYELAGVNAGGAPTLGSGNLATAGLERFGLNIVPEPSVIALGALGLGALLLRRRK